MATEQRRYPIHFGQQVGAERGLPADLQRKADEIRDAVWTDAADETENTTEAGGPVYRWP